MIYRKNVFYDTEKVERRRGMLRRVTQESLFRSTVTALSHRKKAERQCGTGFSDLRKSLFRTTGKTISVRRKA